MTGSDDNTGSRPISVSELLARHGTAGAPSAGGRRRRRRGSDAVSVAELTGEIPIVTSDTPPPADYATATNGMHPDVAEPDVADDGIVERGEPADFTASQPELFEDAAVSTYVEPMPTDAPPAEEMRPDSLDEGVDVALAEPKPVDDTPDLSAFFTSAQEPLFGEREADDPFLRDDGRYGTNDEPYVSNDEFTESSEARSLLDGPAAPTTVQELAYPREAGEKSKAPGRGNKLLHSLLIVGQSILAVAFGAGLFIAFDELWEWNSIVALLLSVLVILGLVVAVHLVRKTEDTASTLIAVAVGALVTIGPLALMQSF